MADSTSNIPGIVVGSESKEQQANALFDAASQAMTYGRNATTSSGLTWGYLGGNVVVSAGTRASIANGTLTLTASQTNYIVAAKADGAVSFATNTTNWNNSDDYWRLYSVVTGTATVTSWVDHRCPGQYQGAGSGGGGGGGMTNPMTTAGDIIVGGASGAPERLAKGTAGHALFAGASGPEYRAIDVDDVAGAVADDDPALTDAREWTAETVGQAEAEAGTANTRRAWTAQRVFQAIAAYISANVASIRTLLGFRETLTANRTYYVRTDGSDSNNGLADTSGGAFLTPQKAWDVAASIDGGEYQITIQIADGTGYGGITANAPSVGSKQIIISGNTTDPFAVEIGAIIFTAAAVSVKGVCATQFYARVGGSISFTDRVAVRPGHGAGQAAIYMNGNGVIYSENQRIDFADGTYGRLVYGLGGQFSAFGSSYYFGASVTVSDAGFDAQRIGLISIGGASFSGSFTGKRYSLASNGVIHTGTGNTSLIPGTVAGTNTDGSGVYT